MSSTHPNLLRWRANSCYADSVLMFILMYHEAKFFKQFFFDEKVDQPIHRIPLPEQVLLQRLPDGKTMDEHIMDIKIHLKNMRTTYLKGGQCGNNMESIRDILQTIWEFVYNHSTDEKLPSNFKHPYTIIVNIISTGNYQENTAGIMTNKKADTKKKTDTDWTSSTLDSYEFFCFLCILLGCFNLDNHMQMTYGINYENNLPINNFESLPMCYTDYPRNKDKKDKIKNNIDFSYRFTHFWNLEGTAGDEIIYENDICGNQPIVSITESNLNHQLAALAANDTNQKYVHSSKIIFCKWSFFMVRIPKEVPKEGSNVEELQYYNAYRYDCVRDPPIIVYQIKRKPFYGRNYFGTVIQIPERIYSPKNTTYILIGGVVHNARAHYMSVIKDPQTETMLFYDDLENNVNETIRYPLETHGTLLFYIPEVEYQKQKTYKPSSIPDLIEIPAAQSRQGKMKPIKLKMPRAPPPTPSMNKSSRDDATKIAFIDISGT